DFRDTGIAVGQIIHVGGLSAENQFFEAENTGFARVRLVEEHKLTLDRRDQAFVEDDGTDDNDGGTGLRIDILFGQFVRNVGVLDSDYREFSNQFELASPNLMEGPATGYEYSLGNYADSLSISIPLT